MNYWERNDYQQTVKRLRIALGDTEVSLNHAKKEIDGLKRENKVLSDIVKAYGDCTECLADFEEAVEKLEVENGELKELIEVYHTRGNGWKDRAEKSEAEIERYKFRRRRDDILGQSSLDEANNTIIELKARLKAVRRDPERFGHDFRGDKK